MEWDALHAGQVRMRPARPACSDLRWRNFLFLQSSR
ncbi:hypothetical protein X757_02855 [Mesorhizobium sp. LSHC414A00]|nr:hypothetical protein X757_02855 [Mesorhizobium sp. LSHC414A00]